MEVGELTGEPSVDPLPGFAAFLYRTRALSAEPIMPTYDYHCRSCGADFNRIEKIADHGREAVNCPECKSAETERVLSAPYPRTARKS